MGGAGMLAVGMQWHRPWDGGLKPYLAGAIKLHACVHAWRSVGPACACSTISHRFFIGLDCRRGVAGGGGQACQARPCGQAVGRHA